MAGETQRRTLEIVLLAKNVGNTAFQQLSGILGGIKRAGGQAFGDLGRAMGSLRAQALATVAALGGIQKLILEPAAFEETLTRLTVGSEVLENEINRVRKSIEDLAVATGTRREDLAAGFEAAGKAARSYEEALQLVVTGNKLATLTGATVADSVTELSGLLEAFGQDISQVDELAADLFETTRRLPGSASGLVGELGKIAPQARDAGLSIEQLLAALTTARQRGVDVGQTMTVLRTILAALVEPTDKLQETFRLLGIQTGERALEGKELGRVFSDMETRARSLGISLTDLGLSGRAIGGFLAIGAEEGKAFREELERIEAATVPDFEAAFARVDNNINSLIEGFRELAKVAASAFAGAQFENLGEFLSGAGANIDRIRIQAEIAGLRFAQWAEHLRPILAIGNMFWQSLQVGLRLIQNGIGAVALGAQGLILALREGAARLKFELASAQADTSQEFRAAMSEWKKTKAEIKRESDAFQTIADEQLMARNTMLANQLDDLRSAFQSFVPAFVESGREADKLETKIESLNAALEALSVTSREITQGAGQDIPGGGFPFGSPGFFADISRRMPSPGGGGAAGIGGGQSAAQANLAADMERSFEAVNSAVKENGQALEERLRALQAFSNSIRDQVANTWSSVFDGFVQGTLSAREALTAFVRDIGSQFTRLFADRAFNAFFGKAGGGGLGDQIFGALANFFGAAKGGVLSGQFMPIQAFAGGGVVTRPTLGILREAGRNEAVVPLPDGRSIPVEGKLGGDSYILNFNLNAVDGPSVERLFKSASGRSAISDVVGHLQQTSRRRRG